METNENSAGAKPCDVVLLPTQEQTVRYRKNLAATAGPRALFGVTVATQASWLADLWERYGDGRAIVSSAQREMIMGAVARAEALDGSGGVGEADVSGGVGDASSAGGAHERGLAWTAAKCVAQAMGLLAFDEAVSKVARGEALPWAASAQIEVLRLVARYEKTCDELGLIEPGRALRLLAPALPTRPCRVVVHASAPLDEQWRAFFSACPQLEASVQEAAGARGASRLPEGVGVRFAFPAGRYATPRLLVDLVQQARTAGELPMVVACKDPLALYADVSSPLSRSGLSCAVRGRAAFAQTDFGRAFFALRRFLCNEQWAVSDLTDFLLLPFSGVSRSDARAIDACVRGDRTAEREQLVYEMRERSDLFGLMEEVVSDPEADVVLGAVEDAVRAMVSRPEAWRREQLAAIAALRGVTAAARLVGADMEACLPLLERTSVDASRMVRACAEAPSADVHAVSDAPAEDGSPEDGAARDVNASAGSSPLPADVLIIDYPSALGFDPGCCAHVVAADLTSAAFPAADAEDACAVMLAKLGIHPTDDALSRMRRSFHALSRLPHAGFTVMRCLNDEDAAPTYPAAVLEEFIDCYRDDPSATDDADNLFSLPPSLQVGLVQRGEELLFENAACARAPQVSEARVPAPRTGELSPEARSLVVLPRVMGREVLREPCLSPSQIESYLECPYKWFASRRLRLEGLDEGFGALQMGDFAHNALCSFYRHFKEEVGAAKVTPETLGQAREIMADVLKRHRDFQKDLRLSENRLIPKTELEARDVDDLERKLMGYLDYEVELLPTFHPEHLEYDVAAGGAVSYAGHKLVGTADRIDVDDANRAVIIDYKASLSGAYALAAREEGNLGKVQALIYAQVVRRELGLDVVGALYVRYGKACAATGAYDARALETPHLPRMKHDACAWTPEKGAFSDLLDRTEEAVAEGVERLLAGKIDPAPATPAACVWCPVLSCSERRRS